MYIICTAAPAIVIVKNPPVATIFVSSSTHTHTAAGCGEIERERQTVERERERASASDRRVDK